MELHDIIYDKYRANNKIHSIMFEVTHRCICDCIHCFLVKDETNELSMDEISDIFRQLRKEGTINIGITGGEPFLRNDIQEILGTARENGFFISLLTTGILIDHAEVSLLKRLNIFHVEISLLGASAETHDGIMQNPGAFDKMINAVKLLKNEGINVTLKSTILKGNYQEIDDMAALCKKLQVNFKSNLLVSPMIDGCNAPQEYMLTKNMISEINQDRINEGLITGEDISKGAILICNAGKTTAGIAPNGDIFPCILMRKKIGSFRENTLNDIWHERQDQFLSEIRSMKMEDVAECFSCDLRSACIRCPGMVYLENRSLFEKSKASCICAEGFIKKN